MTEPNEAELKQTMDPAEVYRRSVRSMSNRQLDNHLRRKARTKKGVAVSNTDMLWATVLSTVFASTKTSGVGGNLSAYLR